MVGARIREPDRSTVHVRIFEAPPGARRHATHGEDVIEVGAVGEGQGQPQRLAREVAKRQDLSHLAVERGVDVQADGLLVDDPPPPSTASSGLVSSRVQRSPRSADSKSSVIGRPLTMHPLLVEIAGVVEVEPEPVTAGARGLRGHVPGGLRDHEERPGLQGGRRAEVGSAGAQRVRIMPFGVGRGHSWGPSGSATVSVDMPLPCAISGPRTTRPQGLGWEPCAPNPPSPAPQDTWPREPAHPADGFAERGPPVLTTCPRTILRGQMSVVGPQERKQRRNACSLGCPDRTTRPGRPC